MDKDLRSLPEVPRDAIRRWNSHGCCTRHRYLPVPRPAWWGLPTYRAQCHGIASHPPPVWRRHASLPHGWWWWRASISRSFVRRRASAHPDNPVAAASRRIFRAPPSHQKMSPPQDPSDHYRSENTPLYRASQGYPVHLLPHRLHSSCGHIILQYVWYGYKPSCTPLLLSLFRQK